MTHDGEPDSYEYASRLATWIWEKHYKNESPHWKPLNDLLGVLTQIDNMTTGLVRAQPETDYEAEFIKDWNESKARRVSDGKRMVPEPEPVDKAGAPCKEFWDWLPKAYRDGDKGDDKKFTKYNMEVAYLAGKQSQPEQKPVAQVDYNERGNIRWLFGPQVPDKAFLYTIPLQREWQGLTDEEVRRIVQSNTDPWCDTPETDGYGVAEMVESKLREKNGNL